MPTLQMLIATANPGKAREFRRMLQGHLREWVDLSAFAQVAAPEETGRTFRANACLKASYYARHTGLWALADDSGLSVDALDGAPGVLSARWAAIHDTGGGGRGDEANNALLLRQMADVPEECRGGAVHLRAGPGRPGGAGYPDGRG